MTPKQHQRQKHRESGKYSKVNPCYVCNKSAGVEYYSHPDSDNTINDELLCLCLACHNKLKDIPGPEAVKIAFPTK